MNDVSSGLAFAVGAFAGTLLIAFLASRLGLYLRRASRFEPATVAGVHAVSFLILSIGACASAAEAPGAPVLAVLVAQAIVFLIDLLRLPRPEDYSDDVPQALRPLTGSRIAAVVAALLVGFALVYAFARPASDGELIARIEADIQSVSGGGLYLAALKRNFPGEYRALAIETVQRLRAQRRRGERGPAADRQLGRDMGVRILAMTASKAQAMAKAPTPALNAYSRVLRDNLLTLQKSAPEACAEFATGRSDEEAAPLPASAQLASGRLMAARLDLARAGLDHPTARNPSAPPSDELRQLAADMQERDPKVAQWLANPAMARFLLPRERCAAAVLYYSAIAALPAEASAAVTAYELSSGS